MNVINSLITLSLFVISLNSTAQAIKGDIDLGARDHLKSANSRFQNSFSINGIKTRFSMLAGDRYQENTYACSVVVGTTDGRFVEGGLLVHSYDLQPSGYGLSFDESIQLCESGTLETNGFKFTVVRRFKQKEKSTSLNAETGWEKVRSNAIPERQQEYLVQQAQILHHVMSDKAVMEFLKLMDVTQIEIILQDNSAKAFKDTEVINSFRIYSDPVLELKFQMTSSGAPKFVSIKNIWERITTWKNNKEIAAILKGRALRQRIIDLQTAKKMP